MLHPHPQYGGTMNNKVVVDIFQTGSGTSTNMNTNEVISNKAIEILGGEIGSKIPVHPNDHVNLGQSSNDVIPTSIHVAAAKSINDSLIPSLKTLKKSLMNKSSEFMPVVKTGRTHLQDATPVRLGQEFLGYAGQIERSINRSENALAELSELAIGGTAVGTGVNTHSEFADKICQKLSESLGIKFFETNNHFQSQSTLDNIVSASGNLKTIAISLMKIANDIRFLGSGPRAGYGELVLPENEPVAGQSGNFEINVMMPVAAYNLLQSINILSTSATNLTTQCIDGIKATSKGPDMVENGLAIVTTLVPHIGYDSSAKIAHKAQNTNKTILEVALEETDLSKEELKDILNPEKMT